MTRELPGRGSKTRLLLYGAYGYTGRLTAELAAARNSTLSSRAATRPRSRIGRSAEFANPRGRAR